MIFRDKIELKNYLLDLDVFVDNEYLDKYVEIIFNNLNTKKELFKTEKHHFIPVCYYKNKYNLKTRDESLPYANSDENNFLINLTHSEHLKSHIYLSFCFNNIRLIHQSMCTVIRMIYGLKRDNINTNITIDNFEDFLNDTNLLSEYDSIKQIIAYNNSERMKDNTLGCKKMTDENKKKLLQSNCGGKYINKNGVVKHLRQDEMINLSTYLDDGWKLGNPNAAHKTSKKGTIHITNGIINKYVYADEFENKYKKLGFYRGFYISKESNNHRIKTMSERMKNKIHVYKDDVQKRIEQSELENYLNNGWKRGYKKNNE